MQWPGTIPTRSYSSFFGAHTDLAPTFLEVAGIHKPPEMLVDGVSLLPILTQAAPAPQNLRDLLLPEYHVVPAYTPGNSFVA